MKNRGGKENWYALLIAIENKKTVTESLENMGIETDKTIMKKANRKSMESKAKIPLSDIEKIKDMRIRGMSGKQIGKVYGCSDVAVYNFIKHYVNRG